MSVFSRIGRAKTVFSRHDLSYEVKFDAHFGKLYPVLLKHMIPSDVFKIGNEVVIRFMPMISPLLHEINVFVHYFFCPYRLLWDGWENFITGGEDGMDNSVQPLWNAGDTEVAFRDSDLINYMGLGHGEVTIESRKLLAYPQLAYNTIWNEYYRDTSIQGEVSMSNNSLLSRSWMKDYFTSARLDTQLGEAPAIPIHGDLEAELLGALPVVGNINGSPFTLNVVRTGGFTQTSYDRGIRTRTPTGDNDMQLYSPTDLRVPVDENFDRGVDTNYMGLAKYLTDYVKVGGTSVDMNQLREIMAIQRWKERNMRAGARYKEYLMARFKNYPRDDRLQRPEYVGGSRSPVIISEVLQTAQGNEISSGRETAIGEMYGHGITVDRQYVAKYRAYEYGLIIGLMSVMPKPSYMNTLEREWTYETRYDYFTPEFQTLGEQPVFLKELVADVDKPDEIFGYQGRYNELRYSPNKVVGKMRNDFAHWHMSRSFKSSGYQTPKLNDDFLKCNPDWQRVFSVTNEPPMIVNFGNLVNAVRPMVAVPNPGLLDHF